MRDERESEIASKFKYGMAGWLANRQRLWRTRRADRLASALSDAADTDDNKPWNSATWLSLAERSNAG